MLKRPSETLRGLTERDVLDLDPWYMINRWGESALKFEFLIFFSEMLMLRDHTFIALPWFPVKLLSLLPECYAKVSWILFVYKLLVLVLYGLYFFCAQGGNLSEYETNPHDFFPMTVANRWLSVPADNSMNTVLVQILYLFSSRCFFYFWNYTIIT